MLGEVLPAPGPLGEEFGVPVGEAPLSAVGPEGLPFGTCDGDDGPLADPEAGDDGLEAAPVPVGDDTVGSLVSFVEYAGLGDIPKGKDADPPPSGAEPPFNGDDVGLVGWLEPADGNPEIAGWPVPVLGDVPRPTLGDAPEFEAPLGDEPAPALGGDPDPEPLPGDEPEPGAALGDEPEPEFGAPLGDEPTPALGDVFDPEPLLGDEPEPEPEPEPGAPFGVLGDEPVLGTSLGDNADPEGLAPPAGIGVATTGLLPADGTAGADTAGDAPLAEGRTAPGPVARQLCYIECFSEQEIRDNTRCRSEATST